MNSFTKYIIIVLFIIIFTTLAWIIFFSETYKLSPTPSQNLSLIEDIRRLEKKLDSLQMSKTTNYSSIVESIQADLKRLEKQTLNIKAIESYRDKFMDEITQRAGSIMHQASFLITSITFIFGAFVIVVGWLSFRKYEELKKELHEKISEREEINNNFQKLDEELNVRKDEIAEFKDFTEKNRIIITQTRDFIGNQIKEYMSYILISLLNALKEKEVIDNQTDDELRKQIDEFQYMLFLTYPDDIEKERAIKGLFAVGTKGSIIELRSIVENDKESPEIRVLAQKAIGEIEKREGKKR